MPVMPPAPGFDIWLVVIIVSAILFWVFFWIVSIYNELIGLRNNINKAWANIDVLLKQRYDLIPNLVEIVKGYMKHEKETLKEITALRTSIVQGTPAERATAHNMLTDALKTIFAVAENYPKLQANQIFMELQKQLTALENQIADRREFYNDSVLLYNTRINALPDMLLARIMGMKEKEYFRATEEEKKTTAINV